jgi:hypothetical protein
MRRSIQLKHLKSQMPQLRLLFFLTILTSANATAACQQSFVSFIRQFEANPNLQLSHTRFPLIYRSIDHEDEFLKMKKVLVDKYEVDEYERFPSIEEQGKLKLIKKFKSKKINQCSVVFNAPDSDIYALEFKFKRLAKTWMLIEIEDNSL